MEQIARYMTFGGDLKHLPLTVEAHETVCKYQMRLCETIDGYLDSNDAIDQYIERSIELAVERLETYRERLETDPNSPCYIADLDNTLTELGAQL